MEGRGGAAATMKSERGVREERVQVRVVFNWPSKEENNATRSELG